MQWSLLLPAAALTICTLPRTLQSWQWEEDLPAGKTPDKQNEFCPLSTDFFPYCLFFPRCYYHIVSLGFNLSNFILPYSLECWKPNFSGSLVATEAVWLRSSQEPVGAVIQLPCSFCLQCGHEAAETDTFAKDGRKLEKVWNFVTRIRPTTVYCLSWTSYHVITKFLFVWANVYQAFGNQEPIKTLLDT